MHKNTNVTSVLPRFSKGQVPSENGTFSAVNGPSKGHHYRAERNKKGTINAVNGTKRAILMESENPVDKTGSNKDASVNIQWKVNKINLKQFCYCLQSGGGGNKFTTEP